MKKTSIGDILELKRGYDLARNEMHEGNIAVVGSNGIIGYHDEATTEAPCITIGRSGTVGIPHIYETPCWVHNTALYVSDFKGNNPYYLFYLLKNLNLERIATSTGVPTLNRNFVHPMKISVVDTRDEQDRIAKILYSIDAQISRNNAMVQKLQSFKPASNFSIKGGIQYAC